MPERASSSMDAPEDGSPPAVLAATSGYAGPGPSQTDSAIPSLSCPSRDRIPSQDQPPAYMQGVFDALTKIQERLEKLESNQFKRFFSQ